ncbi:MAG: glycosyl transferase, partial [Geobacteraceae bacterium]
AQLNAGAAASRAPTFLFLHADSRFDDPMSLRKGLDCLAATIASRGHERLAGRFRLRFDRTDPAPSFGYYFYECKARLNRAECIHGDQGFLLRKSFFASVGPFPEALPMLAETRFAEIARENGEWLLLPADIYTSARRFEVEGLRTRQTLNAIIMNFAALDWQPFFQAIPLLYPRHDHSRQLQLTSILRGIAALIRELPLGERLSIWYRTGGYVRANAWQLAFALDAWRGFRRGIPVSAGRTPLLNFYDRWLDCLTDHPPGRLVAAGIVWLWFRYRLGGAG